jgi:hypothetical protein
MSVPKIKVLKTHTVSYNDREGTPQTRDFSSTGPNGRMEIKAGGSAYLGKLTLVVALGSFVTIMQGLIARIRVDGTFVIEPTKRDPDWFPPGEDVARRGAHIVDFLGDESRNELAVAAAKALPELAKRYKSASAELAKRAAA